MKTKLKNTKTYRYMSDVKKTYNMKKSLKLNPARYEERLKKWYFRLTGDKLDLNNPKNFNEKIQWLKLNDNLKIKSLLTDKFLVKDWIEDEIGKEYVVKLLGVYDKFENICFDEMPDKFVIKCNHGSGYNWICDNIKDFNSIGKVITKKLKVNFAFNDGFELQYKNIEPKIIIEEYLGDNLIDCQFWCSNGEILFISYIKSPHGENKKVSFNEKWEKLDFVSSLPVLYEEVEKPKKLKEMISIAKKVSKKFKFVRVDFYVLEDGSIKISEFTFTPASGIVHWYPKEANYELGNKIKLD